MHAMCVTICHAIGVWWWIRRAHVWIIGTISLIFRGIIAKTVAAAGSHVTGVIPKSLSSVELSGYGVGEIKEVDDMFERKKNIFELSDAFIST